MHQNSTSPKPVTTAGAPTPRRGLARPVPTGVAMALVAVLGLSLIGTGTASAAAPAAPAGGHTATSPDSGSGSGSGGDGGTWDQNKIPLPHLPGQDPVFDRGLQTSTTADVVALDQTSEFAADAAMITFYQDNTSCTVDTQGGVNVQDTIICPDGTATTTDAFDSGTWVHVFRLVN